MPRRTGDELRRYGVAALAVLGATALRLPLDPLLGEKFVHAPFLLAVMVASPTCTNRTRFSRA